MKFFAENILLALGLGGLLASSPAISAAERSPASGTPASDLAALLRLDPHRDANLDELARGAEALRETAKEQERQSKAARREIRAALIASGYDAAEVKLYQEKLVSRRDQMVRDLKLADEIPLLRTNSPDRQFSYDPVVHGPVTVVLHSRETVSARRSTQTVSRGRLVRK